MYGSDVVRSGNNRKGDKHRQTSHRWKIVAETSESVVVARAACVLWMFHSHGCGGCCAAGGGGWSGLLVF